MRRRAGPGSEPAKREGAWDFPSCDCITCGDEGLPMRVLRVDERRELALCEDAAGGHSSVEVALVAPVAAGDLVLVHAGTALVRLEEAAP